MFDNGDSKLRERLQIAALIVLIVAITIFSLIGLILLVNLLTHPANALALGLMALVGCAGPLTVRGPLMARVPDTVALASSKRGITLPLTALEHPTARVLRADRAAQVGDPGGAHLEATAALLHLHLVQRGVTGDDLEAGALDAAAQGVVAALAAGVSPAAAYSRAVRGLVASISDKRVTVL